MITAHAGEDVEQENTPPLLVGVQTCTAAMKISMIVSQKIGNPTTSRSSISTVWHIPKGCTIILQGHLLNHVCSNIIRNTQTSSTEEWIRKIWYIYTMEYYSMGKKNDILKFAGKWKGLEKVILSEVTKTRKTI